MPDSVRKAALGDVGRPVNPHAQRLQVAAHKQVRQLTVPKAKAKSKAKAKPKAKAKTKNKNPKPKTEGKKTKTVYGIAKDEYFQMPLGSMRMTASCRPCSHELKNCCTTNLRLKDTYGDLSRADKEWWWTRSKERVRAIMNFSDSEVSRRRY